MELESKLWPSIQSLDFGSRRDHQFYFTVVKFVHQRDKTPGLVLLIGGQHRDVGYDDGRIPARNLDVVLLAARAVADVFKIEPRDALGGPFGANAPAKNVQHTTDDDIA